jgi:hypothetical protein
MVLVLIPKGFLHGPLMFELRCEPRGMYEQYKDKKLYQLLSQFGFLNK